MDPRLIIHRSVELERACAYVRPDGRPPRQLVMQADGRGPSVALHRMSAVARWRGCTECGACQVEHGEEQAVGRRARTWCAAVRAPAAMPCAGIARWRRSVGRGSTSHPVENHPIPLGTVLAWIHRLRALSLARRHGPCAGQRGAAESSERRRSCCLRPSRARALASISQTWIHIPSRWGPSHPVGDRPCFDSQAARPLAHPTPQAVRRTAARAVP